MEVKLGDGWLSLFASQDIGLIESRFLAVFKPIIIVVVILKISPTDLCVAFFDSKKCRQQS